MREKLYAAINDAIDNRREITLIMSNGTFAGNICIIPDAFDIGDVEMIIYSDNTFITINANMVLYNDIDEVYIISGIDDEIMIAC